MKRNSFLQLCMAASALVTAPFSAMAKVGAAVRDRLGKGFKVPAGQDRFNSSITLMEGDTFFTKIATADTDGDVFAFESTRIVNGGPPLHFHPAQDEWFYILEGEFLFKIGEETFEAKAGDSVFGPRMVPHAFSKTGEGKARMLILYQPAGKMEAYFKAVSKGELAKLTEAERNTVRKEHGFQVVGPALVHEKK